MLFSIEDDTEESGSKIGVIRLVKSADEITLFYTLNKESAYSFHRKEDLIIETDYHRSHYSVFKACHPDYHIPFYLISNHADLVEEVRPAETLFYDELGVKLLLNNYPEAEYIMWCRDPDADFSLFLFPQQWVFPVQTLALEEDSLLLSYLEHYDA